MSFCCCSPAPAISPDLLPINYVVPTQNSIEKRTENAFKEIITPQENFLLPNQTDGSMYGSLNQANLPQAHSGKNLAYYLSPSWMEEPPIATLQIPSYPPEWINFDAVSPNHINSQCLDLDLTDIEKSKISEKYLESIIAIREEKYTYSWDFRREVAVKKEANHPEKIYHSIVFQKKSIARQMSFCLT